ncbi:ABC transporter ATP-binding protein [Blastococcus sp. HT6-30]|uniref:ABC transporter ATP-binding protein n=1 Tax=Blastococcus sp. HT6-30 TaxID=3144843 RepID=UPI0032195491
MPLLEIRDMRASYNAVPAVHIDEITVEEGELVAVLGPNGVGKSTTLSAISRTVSTVGTLRFDGEDLGPLRPADVIRLGVVHAPEGRLLFPEMTVTENLRMGAFLRSDKAEIERDLEFVQDLFPILAQRARQDAGTLSGGEQQMCAIGRALMARPRLLLLDEPSFGLAPVIVERIERVIADLNRERKLSMLLVEQNVSMALGVASRAYVLENGRVARHGSSRELSGDPDFRRAYLGVA